MNVGNRKTVIHNLRSAQEHFHSYLHFTNFKIRAHNRYRRQKWLNAEMASTNGYSALTCFNQESKRSLGPDVLYRKAESFIDFIKSNSDGLSHERCQMNRLMGETIK